MDNLAIIDDLILRVDKLADAHGTEKCALVIEMIQQLSALKRGVQADREELTKLRAKIDDDTKIKAKEAKPCQ